MKPNGYSAFRSQKANAKRRGIGWELTFDQWLEFWGDDLDKRGSGKDCLQMQRHEDTGPYAVGNIRKGKPKQNSATYSAMYQNRRTAKAAAEPVSGRMVGRYPPVYQSGF